MFAKYHKIKVSVSVVIFGHKYVGISIGKNISLNNILELAGRISFQPYSLHVLHLRNLERLYPVYQSYISNMIATTVGFSTQTKMHSINYL